MSATIWTLILYRPSGGTKLPSFCECLILFCGGYARKFVDGCGDQAASQRAGGVIIMAAEWGALLSRSHLREFDQVFDAGDRPPLRLLNKRILGNGIGPSRQQIGCVALFSEVIQAPLAPASAQIN